MAARRKPTLKQRQKLADEMRALVLGLFEPNSRPFFDRGDYSQEALDDFIKCEAVFDETFQFIDALTKIWKEQNPDIRSLVPLPVLPPQIHDVDEQTIPPSIQEPAMNTEDAILPKPLALPEPIPESPATLPVITPPPAPLPNPSLLKPGQTPPMNTPPNAPLTTVPPVRFVLPNAKVGVDYRARVEGQTAEGAGRVVELRMPNDLGLHFDAEHAELYGIPTLAGEHSLHLRWTLNQREHYSSECVLIVNPDPRTLWQVKEPAADAPYFKAHTAHQALTGFGFRIAAASRRGRSHEHNGTFRDDDFVINL
ncbi:MAG: protein phosphatase 2C domain-containing protein, partial [Chromatium okenii]|nr:protein phosphatase 2C domain-containing protein [Chromatium okenii]